MVPEHNPKNKDQQDSPQSNAPKKQQAIFQSVEVYTILRILKQMRKELGLEAMIEYVDAYLRMMNKHNQPLELAVTKALSLMSMGRLYGEVLYRNKK